MPARPRCQIVASRRHVLATLRGYDAVQHLLHCARMKCLVLAFGLLATPSTIALADDTPASVQRDGRLVPALRDGKLVGLKVYAIRPGGRFDRAKLENGDLVVAVDGQSVATDDGARLLHDKLSSRRDDLAITVERRGQSITLGARR